MTRFTVKTANSGRVSQSWGWGASLGVHLAVLALAALWMLPVPAQPHPHAIVSTWQTPADADKALELPAPLQTSVPSGGASSAAEFLVSDHAALSRDVVSDWSPWDVVRQSAIGPETTGGSPASDTKASTSTGSGKGSGDGVGDDYGPGFFGLQPPAGKRVVFVVDNSRSMNHPHDSPAKTRYRRLKLELLKCIWEMNEGQTFFVVFFSNETTPMPAPGLQPALPGVRDPYLKWIAQLPSGGGPTDPLPALNLGMRLQPDVLCFLTDGEFEPWIGRRLSSLRQTQTAIHTFAFGDIRAEETLRALAEHNGGEYRFIP